MDVSVFITWLPQSATPLASALLPMDQAISSVSASLPWKELADKMEAPKPLVA
jgi:hypothetical protein